MRTFSSAVTFTKEETEKTDQEAKESVSDNHAQNAEALTSVREILKGFARETSMHGLKNAAHHNRAAPTRIVWCLLVLTMAASLTYTGICLYLRYRSYPYTTTFSINRLTTIPLPAVTVCLRSSFHTGRLDLFPHSDMLKHYLLSISDFSSVIPSNWTSDRLNAAFGNLSYEEVLQVASFEVSDIVLFATLGLRVLNISEVFQVVDIFGKRCFSFNSAIKRKSGEYRQEAVTPSEHLTLYLSLNKSVTLPSGVVDGLTVYIHDPWEMIHMYDSSASVHENTATFLLLNPVQYRFLPYPYLSFGGDDCMDTEDPGFKSPLGINLEYTWRNCIIDAASRRATLECQCVAGWVKDDYDLPICSLSESKYCYDPVYERETVAQSYGMAENLCLTQCAFKEYQYKATSVPYPSQRFRSYITEHPFLLDDRAFHLFQAGYTALDVAFESPLVTEMQHDAALSLSDIYSLLGGQMGFFLGASLLTLTELLEAVISLFWTLVSTRCRTNVRSARANSPAHDDDAAAAAAGDNSGGGGGGGGGGDARSNALRRHSLLPQSWH